MTKLCDAQVEHLMAVFADVDLSPLAQALSGGSFLDVLMLVPMLGQVREKRLLRRLSGILASSAQELLDAEADDAKWAGIEAKGAARAWEETRQELADFFGGLGISKVGTPGSLEMLTNLMMQMNPPVPPETTREPSLSGD